MPGMNPDDDAARDAVRERFLAACEQALHEGRFERLLLAGYRGAESDLKRITVRAIVLRGEPQLSFVTHYERRDLTRNLPQAQGLQTLRGLLGTEFANAHLHTPQQELQLAYSRKGRASLPGEPAVHEERREVGRRQHDQRQTDVRQHQP